MASSRKRLELQVSQLEQQGGELDDQSRKAAEAGHDHIAEEAQARRGATEARLADLRRQYAGLQAEEERVTGASRRLHAKVDAFRVCKEVVEAAYRAAEDAAAWAEAINDAGPNADGGGDGGDSAAGDTVSAGPDGPAGFPFGLSELRPGAPEPADARILFTVEPSGTAVLLAAGMESDRLHAWYAEVIAQCRIRYKRGKGARARREAGGAQRHGGEDAAES